MLNQGVVILAEAMIESPFRSPSHAWSIQGSKLPACQSPWKEAPYREKNPVAIENGCQHSATREDADRTSRSRDRSKVRKTIKSLTLYPMMDSSGKPLLILRLRCGVQNAFFVTGHHWTGPGLFGHA